MDPRQNKSSQCLMTLISAKLLPISFVLGPELRAFVSSLNACYTVPTRNTTQKQLNARSDLLKTKVNVLIGETDSVCITVDLWTNAVLHRHHYARDRRLRDEIGNAGLPTSEGPAYRREHCAALRGCYIDISFEQYTHHHRHGQCVEHGESFRASRFRD